MSYQSTESYYLLLGLRPGASDADIRHAYRRLAKQLHPDRNKSPHAHQDFINLSEAYEYLINHHDDGRSYTQTSYTQSTQQTYSRSTYEQRNTDAERREQARAEARRRAAEHAEMRYDDFVDSDWYRSVASMEVIFKHLIVLFFLLFMVAIVTALLVSKGAAAPVTAGMVLVLYGSILLLVWRNQNISITELHESLSFVVRQRWFHAIVITVVNLYIIDVYCFETLITLGALLFVYLASMLASLLAIGRFAPQMHVFDKRFYSLSVVPLFVGLLFAVNFIFASSATQETYYFYNHESAEGPIPMVITLEDNKYDDYTAIRSFTNNHFMAHTNYVTYTFADGLMGLRVVKDFRFERRY